MTNTSFLDLPVDLILLIVPHLEVHDFLNLTASCKALHEQFLNESRYWAEAIRTTFRVASQAVVQDDGVRWRKMYKRLKADTRAYGWGDNTRNCLSQWLPIGSTHHRPRPRPTKIHDEFIFAEDIGVISDIQSGGWSTSMLTSNGALHIFGSLDDRLSQSIHIGSKLLEYPSGFVQPKKRYDSATAVRQYSHGRSHLLALSDSGRIWSWRNASQSATNIKFIDHETCNKRCGVGAVVKVVAGWSKSAALIEGSGIVVWEPVGRYGDTEMTDTALVLESAVVPTKADIGRIINFIVLEECVVFITDIGKVYQSRIIWTRQEQRLAEPIEVPTDGYVVDVQGAFRNFAVFLKSGSVLTSTQEKVFSPEDSIYTTIPALQNTQVIELAFGDYHFHALHASGHITSYGTEPQCNSTLGLGVQRMPGGKLRGLRCAPQTHPQIAADGILVPHANLSGRQIWFEDIKERWISFLEAGGVDKEEAAERMLQSVSETADVSIQGELSEWIEQEGRDWEEKYGVRGDEDDGLPAYFAWNITAAGWHSAALVSVDESLITRLAKAVETSKEAEQLDVGLIGGLLQWMYNTGCWFLGLDSLHRRRIDESDHRYIWANDHFPRLRLSDNTTMPGTAPINKWRYGEPDWSLVS